MTDPTIFCYLERSVAHCTDPSNNRQEPECPAGTESGHQQSSKQTARTLPNTKEQRPHETHHAGNGGGGADLGHVGHRRGHHQGHGEPL